MFKMFKLYRALFLGVAKYVHPVISEIRTAKSFEVPYGSIFGVSNSCWVSGDLGCGRMIESPSPQ